LTEQDRSNRIKQKRRVVKKYFAFIAKI
jgi:hypothetical protein